MYKTFLKPMVNDLLTVGFLFVYEKNKYNFEKVQEKAQEKIESNMDRIEVLVWKLK